MTIQSDITKNIQEMSTATQQLDNTIIAENAVDQEINQDVYAELEKPSVFTEIEPIEVAGNIGRKEALDLAKDAVKKALKEKLGEKGVTVEKDIKVIEPTPVIENEKKLQDTVEVLQEETKPRIKPKQPSELEIVDQGETKIIRAKQYYKVDDEAIQEIASKRERILQEGTERVKPGIIEGVDVNRISTLPYDEASEAATVKASSQAFIKEYPKSKKVKDVFAEAERRGIDSSLLSKVASGKGIDLEAKLGTKGAGDLPDKVAGYIKLHDDNVAVLDDLFEKLQRGDITDVEKYNLKQHLIWHQEILKGMSNVQTDVAVSLNLFKRASVDMKGMKNISAAKMDELNKQSLNEKTLKEFAEFWNLSPTVKGKNKLVLEQKSFNEALSDSIYTIYKTNLLSSPDTMMENLLGATVTGVKTHIDDWSGALWGTARRKILKQPITKNDMLVDDIVNSYIGFGNAIRDGLEAARITWTTNKRIGYRKDIELSEQFLQSLSDKPIKVPFTDKVIGQSPKADQAYWKAIIQAGSYLPNLVLKTLATGDEFAGALFSRMKLHQEASRYARNRMADLIQAGKSTDEAYEIASAEVKSFLNTQPANIYKNVQQAREFINLRYRFANEVKDVDVLGMPLKSVKVGTVYNWVNDKLAKFPLIKWMQPFSNSLTRIFEMSAASIPGLAALAPTYWEDKAAGGARRDRANGRMAMGFMILLGFKQLADQGVINGYGPSDPKFASTLKARGRIPYSIRLGISEYTPKDLDSLRKIMNEDEMQVAKNGDLYVSFERIDIFSVLAGISADFVEYTRYARDYYNTDELNKLSLAALSTAYQFLGNSSWFEQTGRFLSSMQAANDRDKGNKLVNFFNQSLTFAGQNATMALPIFSVTWNSFARKFATTWDEQKKTYDANVMNIDTTNDTEVMLSDIAVQMRQNNPILRGSLVDQYDNLGRPVYDEEAYVDSWLKHFPGIRMSKEHGEKVDRMMEVYQVGVGKPDKTWDGVELSSYQYETFKRLYGNDIKLPATNYRKQQTNLVNLRESIVTEIDNLLYRNDAGVVAQVKKEDIQKLIDLEVEKYRRAAKAQMIGSTDDVLIAPGVSLKRHNNYYIDPITKMKNNAIMFPELSNAINSLKNFKREQ